MSLMIGLLILSFLAVSLVAVYRQVILPPLNRAAEDNLTLPAMKKASGMHPRVMSCATNQPASGVSFVSELQKVHDWVVTKSIYPDYLGLCLTLVEPILNDPNTGQYIYNSFDTTNAIYGCPADPTAVLSWAHGQATLVVEEMRHNYFIIGVLYYSSLHDEAGVTVTSAMLGQPAMDKDPVFVSPGCL